jgi:hypothetical protein
VWQGSCVNPGDLRVDSMGRLLRFVDANRNGVADTAGTIAANIA